MSYRAYTKTAAKAKARLFRKKGYNCSIFKKKKGWGVSVKRK